MKLDQHQQSEFLQDIQADIKNERYRLLWATYGKYISSFLTIIIVSAGAYSFYKNHEQKKIRQYSGQFLEAEHFIEQGKIENALALLKPMIGSSTKLYEIMSKFLLASTLNTTGKTDDAITAFHEIIATNDFFFKPLALIRVAYIYLDRSMEDVKKIEPELCSVAQKGSFVYHLAQEVLAMIALKGEDYVKASSIFLELSQDSSTPAALRTRARLFSQDMACRIH